MAGNGLLNVEIQALCVQLLVGQIPKKWETLWEGADDPADWLKAFGKKIAQLRKWVDCAISGNILN